MLILGFILSLAQPNSDSLAKKYTYKYQLCNTVEVINKYVEIEFMAENKFSFFTSLASGAKPFDSKFITGDYTIEKNTVILKPAAEYLNLPTEIIYKITTEGLIKQTIQIDTPFPYELNKEKEISPLQQQDSMVPTYYYHSQSCHVWYTVDYFWKLEVKKDSSFVLTKSSVDSRGFQPVQKVDSRNKKNEALLSRNMKTSFLTGNWLQKKDTLTLSPSFCFPIGNETQLGQMKFQVLSKSIKPINDSINYFPKEMELIEPKQPK